VALGDHTRWWIGKFSVWAIKFKLNTEAMERPEAEKGHDHIWSFADKNLTLPVLKGVNQ
jgi:hypothetical protein